MHNSAPKERGSDAWYAWIEQKLMQHGTDVSRLWDIAPQNPDNLGDPPHSPDWEDPLST
jgi:hypothetical protein